MQLRGGDHALVEQPRHHGRVLVGKYPHGDDAALQTCRKFARPLRRHIAAAPGHINDKAAVIGDVPVYIVNIAGAR